MAKSDKVKIRIPKLSQKEEPNLFVGINGVNYLIPRGKEVEVPQFVADEIERSNAAREKFFESVETLSAKEPRK